jgi:hypothetical protein
MNEEPTGKWIEEIRLQCRFASHAWQEMRRSLIGMDNEKSFFYVHAFLNHSMEIAQILWPNNKDCNERGKGLREALKLTEDNLLNQSSIRRIVTHFDERLELWMGTADTPHFLNLNVMPKGTVADAREDVFVRSFDSETYRLEILDQTFDLRDLYQTIRQLDKTAETWRKLH